MALQGKLTHKGVEINQAYVMVTEANYRSEVEEKTESTAATYNEDGSIATEEVVTKTFVKVSRLHYACKVYANKNQRETKPYDEVYKIARYVNEPKVNNTAKNFVIQAYEHIKTVDAYKDLADA